MRLPVALPALVLSIALSPAALSRSACDLLPASLVHTISGRAVEIDTGHSGKDDAGWDVCAYSSAGAPFRLSILSLESETAARRAFAREVARSFPGAPSPQPLRGVGVEARIRVSKPTHSGVIVARHGAVVFVLRAPFEQETLVALARSVVASLESAQSR